MTSVVVDTNILVRLATGDSPGEHRAVLAALATWQWQILVSVVMETEGVLRSVYGYSPEQFVAFIEWLHGHPQVSFAQAEMVKAALEHHRAGLDFADALHLAQAGALTLLTLDRKLLRSAGKLGLNARSPAVAA
ncbi:MAG TPA: type II toxin-antitoxin system VapC family toxin [Rubrivivax sp.]|nr:type II toxin-antitoxin system VapC family toxin [Rubrivivax sp.]